MTIVALLAFVPAQYTPYVLAMLGIASVADALVPQVTAGPKWLLLARAALHALGMNWDKARLAMGKKPA